MGSLRALLFIYKFRKTKTEKMKKRFNTALIFLFSIVLANLSQASCDIDTGHLWAEYHIEFAPEGRTEHLDEDVHTEQFQLYRKNKEVAHVYPEAQMTEFWSLEPNGFVRPTRFFDEHRRAIEYAAADINNGRGDKSWDSRFQLVEGRFLARMNKVETSGEGCSAVEHYSLTNEQGVKTVIKWMPELLLVSYLEIKTEKGLKVWEMQRYSTDTSEIDALFKDRYSYKSTDYVDIGDNESDPFLRNMINLGFVEHGASGFYSSDGRPLHHSVTSHGH